MKRLLLVLATAVLLGIAAFAWTFTAATLEKRSYDIGDLPQASPPAEMSLSMLPTGANLARAGLAFRGGSFSDEREFVMHAILIRHPKGNLLVDAGFGSDVDEHVKLMPALMQRLTSYSKGTPAAEQLKANGFDPSNLAGVVLTHSHWDHVSGLDSFPGVPVWVNAAEKGFIATRPETELVRVLEPLKYELYDFDSGPYLSFPRSYDVWGDGAVVIVPAPGHTPGSVVVFVTLPSGTRYALLGDLVWQLEGIELPAERPWLARRMLGENAEQVRENILRIVAIHERFPEIQLVPSHDARAAAKLPVFPEAAR